MAHSADPKKGEDALFLSKISDAVELCERRGIPQFTAFLDQRQAAFAQAQLNHLHHKNALFFGGFAEAERTVLGVFPEGDEPSGEIFPIRPLTIRYRVCDILTHRDFLGSLMSFGIERSTIGDILIEDGRTVIFVLSEMAGYIMTQMEKVGRVGVKLTGGAQEPYPPGRGFERIEGTVSSMRLDAVLAAALHISREKGAQLILSGQVQKNSRPVLSVSAPVGEGDKLSVRGYGRFLMEQTGIMTRKGRYKFSIRKYN